MVIDSHIEKIDFELDTMPDALSGMFLIRRPIVSPTCSATKSHTSRADMGAVKLELPKLFFFYDVLPL